MKRKIKFPKFPADPYYFQCHSHGNINLAWCHNKQEQKGTYWIANKL